MIKKNVHVLERVLQSSRLFWGLLLGWFVFLIWRLLHFVSIYAVNLPVMDQWDVMRGYFDGYSFWENFRIQHGSHRQGVGAWFSNAIARYTDFNLIAEVQTMVVVNTLSAVLATWLVYKVVDRRSYLLFLVPLVILNLSQYEVFVGAPNPAHGILPQLLIILIAASQLIKLLWWRVTLTIFLGLLCSHTGFGYIMMPVILGLTVFEWTSRSRKGKSSLVLTLYSLGAAGLFVLYFSNYISFDLAAPKLPVFEYWKFPAFVVALFSRALGASRVNVAMLPAAFLVAALLWWGSRRTFSALKGQEFECKEKLIWTIVSASVLFAFATSMGRLGFGIGGAISSRYVPYLSLGVLGFFVLFRSSNKNWLRYTYAALVVFFVSQELRPRGRDFQIAAEYRDSKLQFIKCYRDSEDFKVCNEASHPRVYNDGSDERLQARLQWMKANRLGFWGE